MNNLEQATDVVLYGCMGIVVLCFVVAVLWIVRGVSHPRTINTGHFGDVNNPVLRLVTKRDTYAQFLNGGPIIYFLPEDFEALAKGMLPGAGECGWNEYLAGIKSIWKQVDEKYPIPDEWLDEAEKYQ